MIITRNVHNKKAVLRIWGYIHYLDGKRIVPEEEYRIYWTRLASLNLKVSHLRGKTKKRGTQLKRYQGTGIPAHE